MGGGPKAVPAGIVAYPGGPTKRKFGMDLAQLTDKLAAKASSASAAQGPMPGVMALQALQQGIGMISGAMSLILAVVVPKIPVMAGKPLPCMPMITGHNCFGAVLYPITTADFAIASTTDAQLDGVIDGFPSLYKRKVGKTSDAMYKACFSAFMGMKCASIFPRCGSMQAPQEPSPMGRLPMCFTHCLATLVACPGMWIEDIMSDCLDVSIPPMCAVSVFLNYWLLPPQYSTYDDSHPVTMECPEVPDALQQSEADLRDSGNLYEDSSIVDSAYSGAVKLPPV